MQRKLPHSSVIAIDSARTSPEGPEPPTQPQPPARNMPNQWTRASFVRMFLLGRGVINISRHHRVAPAAVETELREELIRGGALDRVQTFRRAA